MKRERILAALLLAAIALAGVVGFWYWRSPESTLVKVGDPAPDLVLTTLGAGTPTALSSYRGRAVLLVMFLSGCHICESEIDDVERLHRQYLHRGLTVVGVAVDADPAARRGFVQRHGLTFFVFEDPNGQAVRAAYGSWKMPEAYLIDTKGVVDAVYLGSVNWQGKDVKQRIERLLPAAATAG
jgi:peroxiredoxin